MTDEPRQADAPVSAEPQPEPLGVSGKPLVLFFAAVIVVAAGVVVAYKIQEAKAPPVWMTFERSSAEASQAANMTVHPLDARKLVGSTTDLDDYLKHARDTGPINLTERLQVLQYADFLRQETQEDGTVVFVEYGGAVIRIQWSL